MTIRTAMALLLLALAGVAESATVSQAAPVTIDKFLREYSYFPVSFRRGVSEHFLLSALAGSSKVTLAVDTGCPFTTVDPRRVPAAKTLGELKTKIYDRFLGEISDPSVLLLPELSIGRARFSNQPARAATLDADYVSVDSNGLLGDDFLARNFCLIDCTSGELYFRGSAPNPGQCKAIYASLKMSGYTPIPIRRAGWPIVRGTACGKKIEWILDTGTRYTLLEEGELARLKARKVAVLETGSNIPTVLEGRVIGLRGIGPGAHHLTAARLSSVTFGDRSWQDVVVGVIDLKMADMGGGRPIDPDVHGFLGVDLLRAHGALIDCSSWLLWLAPEAQ